MLQDEGKEILRRAAKYLQRNGKTAMRDEGDYCAINLLRWMFTTPANSYAMVRDEDG